MSVLPDLSFIEAMERAVTGGDVAEASRYLREDIAYTVGAQPPVRGVDAVLRYTARQAAIVRWDGHTLVGHWPVDGAMIVEVVSHFTRLADGRKISFPCTDIYRFKDGRISDWRVYADMSPFSAS